MHPATGSRSLNTTYKKHEDEKETYSQHMLNIEHAVFTLLVLSTTGGMETQAQTLQMPC